MKLVRLLALGSLLLSGCVQHATARGEALYPFVGGQPYARSAVAGVSGALESIDDKSVKAGQAYEVLPGCHQLRNYTRWGGSDAYTAVAATLPSLLFSINMRPGYNYVIRVAQALSTGSGGTLEIIAEEQTLSGVATKRYQPGQPCS